MRYFYIFIVLVVFICNCHDLFSQKYFNNWYFGKNAGITFNTISGEPEVLIDGALVTDEGCSAISDSLGNLLFYTDGRTVWNRFHEIMPNGIGLFGHSSAAQSAIIVPKPGKNPLYYIFTVFAEEGGSNKVGLNYSIVDLSLDNGSGVVTQKNIHLLDLTSERLIAAGHKNGKDVWIITQDRNEKCFVSYLLSKDSLTSFPVKSPCSIDFSKYQAGIMKISQDVKKLAFTYWADYSVYLYNFDDSTGTISDEINFNVANGQPYGIEFSDNNQFLYVSCDIINTQYGPIKQYLYQYDISSSNVIQIKNSEFPVFDSDEETSCWALQLGPNKKIYMVRNNKYLSVINKPNEHGKSCDFKLDKIYLEGKSSNLGLPPTIPFFAAKPNLISNLTFCEGSPVLLISGFYSDAEYKWTGPGGFSSILRNPVIIDSKPEMSGAYKYQISRNDTMIFEGTINVEIFPKPKILFSDIKELILCADSYNLKAVEDSTNVKITWLGINSKNNSVTITQSGKYKVFVENIFGCIDSALINIKLYPHYCEGDTIFLIPDIYEKADYSWSGPDEFKSTQQNPVIPNCKVSMSGDYNTRIIIPGKVYGKFDTVDTKIPVIINPKEKILFSDKKKITSCLDSIILVAVSNPNGCKIRWKGIKSNENKVIIRADGIYTVFVENEFGCIDSASIDVRLNQKVLDVKILSVNGNILCKGNSTRLSANDDFNEYKWSTGETTKEITIYNSGKYILNVSSEAGCKGVDSILIDEYEKPEISFEKSKYIICKGDSIILSPLDVNPDYDYSWSDGLKKPQRFINDNADLYIIATSKFGCKDTAYVKVEALELPVAKIISDKTEACFGDKIILKAENYNPEFQYFWSNSEKGEEITVDKSGTYSLVVSNGNLCVDSTKIEVIIHSDLALEVLADNTNLCFDDSTRIYPTLKYDKYLWSTGENTESITVQKAGVYQLIVQNDFGCSDTAKITISKYDAKLISDADSLVFNELCLGSSETKSINLTLSSNYNFHISNIYFKSNKFSINNINNYLKSYKDGETIDLPVNFKPSDAGEFMDTLVIESDEPCIYQKSIPIQGSSKALFRFSLPNIITSAGNYLMIPINAGMTCLNSDKLNSDYEIEISFDKMYFAPDSVKYGNIIENKIKNQERIITIKSSAEFKEKTDSLMPINFIYGMSLMGHKEIIPLTIDYVHFTNSRYYPDYINGSLKIENCLNNISTIQMFNPTKLSIAPNPADGDIKMSIGTQEKGSFKIEIFDVQGQSIYSKEFMKSDSKYEEFEYYYDTKELGSGVYSIHLTSPWNILRQQLVISK